MDSVLEQQRRLHEEVERIESAIVDELLVKPKAHKEKIIQEHRVNNYLELIQKRSKTLKEFYNDKDGSRKKEINSISGASEFSEFYQRLKSIKDYHRRYPNEVVEPMELEFKINDTEREEKEIDNMFSGEEAWKYFDLHIYHEQYINLKNVENINYLNYLDKYDQFTDIPMSTKMTESYKNYINNLKGYFEGYFKKAQPLFNLKELNDIIENEFEESWNEGTVPGWKKDDNMEEDNTDELFCVACKKQFQNKTVYEYHLNGKKHKKAAEKLLKEGVMEIKDDQIEKLKKEALQKRLEHQKPIALTEAYIREYSQNLASVREETKSNVERKQVLNEKEFEEDVEEVEIVESEEEDDDKIYNPLKLPLGFDGKPIPFWLYKLHGLGEKYPCEICGNYIYMGRKAFDRHFQEWRHAHGMRCLGIPNTRHFHEITLIEDAYTLWEKLKSRNKTQQFKSDTMEEYEDSEGNVFNKKTYEDLKKQGLL